MAHIYGDEPFPWTNPCGRGLSGISHISPPCAFSESPKAVLTDCTMFCRVVNLQWIGYLGSFTICKARDTMLCTTNS